MSGSLHEFASSLTSRYPTLRGRVGVAVSGGADSVFLLHALRDAGLAGVVLHVNHQLRAAESDDDAAFVAALAQELGLHCIVGTLPPAPGNLEQEARRARYAWFEGCISEKLCDVVATGHTLEDQAETLLSRFLRGAGTAGLSGILPKTVEGLIRPLLGLSREDIRTDLHRRNIRWREDSSNLNSAFLRNRVRRDLMPTLLSINPSLPSTLANTAEWAQAEEAYWTAEVANLSRSHLTTQGETVLMNTSTLFALPLAVTRRLLRHAVRLVRGSLRTIDFHHIEAIRQLCESKEGSGRLQLPGLDVYRSFDWLRLSPLGFDARLERDFAIPIPFPGRMSLPDRALAVEMELVSGNRVYNSDLQALDPARLQGQLVLRNWRPGDSLRIRGAASAEKIKTLFQEHRIPLWERRAWPVIALDRTVVWTRRFGVATEFAAAPDCESVVLVHDVPAPAGRP